MTKPRKPGSLADAIMTILGAIGRDTAAALVKRGQDVVYDWADEENPALPDLDRAARLDAAFVKATGERPPVLYAYRARIEELLGAPLEDAQRKVAPADRLSRLMVEVSDAARAYAECSAQGRPDPALTRKLKREIEDVRVQLAGMASDLGGDVP